MLEIKYNNSLQKEEKILRTPHGEKITQNQKDNLIKITGTLTSSLQLRGEGTKEPYYYSFIRLKGQTIDLPVIFKLKDEKVNLTELKKSDQLELTGHYSNSEKNVRKSFTYHTYQLLNERKIRKKCFGCLDSFACSSQKNYDYCSSCSLNGNRYLTKDNKCSECDGSGIIKFPHQPPRACKLCYLTNQTTKLSLDQKREENIFTKNA